MNRIAAFLLIFAGLAVAATPAEPRMDRIEFRGNKGIRAGRLKKALQQKESGWGRPVVFRARLARQDSLAVLALYRREGFLRARVDSVRIYGASKMIERFYVTENERHRLLSLDFAGRSSLSAMELRSALELKPRPGFRKAGFDPAKIPVDSLSLLTLYRTRGYLDAVIDSVKHIYDAKYGARLTYFIRENARYEIDSVSIAGHRFLSEKSLRSALGLEKGDALDLEQLGAAQIAVARLYTDEGFLDAQMDVDPMRLPGGYVDLRFTIHEGRRLRVAGIRVYGNQQTKTSLIRQAFPIGVGEWINYSRIMRGQKRLYETGLFSSISIELEPQANDSSQRVVVVQVRERKASSLEFGGGYATQEGWRGLSGISANNVWGEAVRASLGLRVSQLESKILLGYSDPWILQAQLKGSMGAEIGFRGDTTRFKIETGALLPVGNYSELGLSYVLEIGNIDTAEQEAYNGALHPLFRQDTRNDLFQTQRGQLFQVEFEYAAPWTFSDFRYAKWKLETRHFVTPIADLTIGFRLQGGVLRSLGTIPTSVLFRTGGDQSVRGYGFEEIPAVIDSSLGCEGMLVGNFEIRKPFWGNWGGVLFTDGTLFSGAEDLAWPWHSALSAGAGLRYSFSLGVLRLDWATRLEKPWTDASGSWYFALGHSF